MSFLDEVKQQPQVLLDFCRTELPAWIGPELRKQFDLFVFAGMGSSCAASYLGASLASRRGLKAFYGEPDTLRRVFPGLFGERTLTIAISQSGGSPETVGLAQSLPSRNVLAVTNHAHETALSRCADHHVVLNAGDELHTATKTYTNSIAAVYRIVDAITGQKTDIAQYEAVAKEMQAFIDGNIGEKIADYFADAKELVVVGSGVSAATGIQTDYVVAEMDHVFTKYITAAEFFHGMIESADPSFNFLICDGDPDFYDRTAQLIGALKNCGSKYMLISNHDYGELTAGEKQHICLPVSDPYLFPMADVVAVELLGLSLGLKRNLTPGDLTHVRK